MSVRLSHGTKLPHTKFCVVLSCLWCDGAMLEMHEMHVCSIQFLGLWQKFEVVGGPARPGLVRPIVPAQLGLARPKHMGFGPKSTGWVKTGSKSAHFQLENSFSRSMEAKKIHGFGQFFFLFFSNFFHPHMA